KPEAWIPPAGLACTSALLPYTPLFRSNAELREETRHELLAVRHRERHRALMHRSIQAEPLLEGADGGLIVFGSDLHAETFSVSKDRKSTRLNSSHVAISYAVFCMKKKK